MDDSKADIRLLWQAKFEALGRFARVTGQVGAVAHPNELTPVLAQREAVMAAVTKIDAELGGAAPPPDLLAAAQPVLAEAQAVEAALRQRLEQAMQQRVERLLAAVSPARPADSAPEPRFLDQRG